jgi:hypothetical protein
METEERLSALERKIEQYEALIDKLRTIARLSPTGRMIVKALGL